MLELRSSPLNPKPILRFFIEYSTTISAITSFLIISGALAAFSYLTWQQFADSYYPGTSIDGSVVEGMTIQQAQKTLAATQPELKTYQVTFIVDDISLASSSAELGLDSTLSSVLETAFKEQHQGSSWQQFTRFVSSYLQPTNWKTGYHFQSAAVEQALLQLATQVNFEDEIPHITLSTSGQASSLKLEAGSIGRAVSISEAVQSLQNQAAPENISLSVPVASVGTQLTKDQYQPALERAARFINKKITATSNDLTFKLNDQELVSLLALPQGYATPKLTEVTVRWATKLNRPAQNAEFEANLETKKVITFVPHRTGLALDESATEDLLRKTLAEIEQETQDIDPKNNEKLLTLPVSETQPAIPLSSTNNLGIKERIGFGKSEYAHSIPNRIHNVSLTTDLLTDTLVAPGEEFSFVKEIGDISNKTGFRSAYVIKNGRTELGDGGGVCQVSTTLFRALLDGGLKISRRINHSYRVGYYEQDQPPGYDATIYSGEIDLRFINDTDHYLVIHAEANATDQTMFVELYGTSDGRSTELTEYKQWGYQSAPAPEFIPDASLPRGVRKQVDWSATGLKTSFKHIIRNKDGAVIDEQIYQSNYRPWSAKYLVGI